MNQNKQIFFVLAVPPIIYPGCCKSKTVGGIVYNLIEKSTAVVPEECSTKCVYEKAGYPNTQYCFAPGSLPVECFGPICPLFYHHHHFTHYVTIINNITDRTISGEVSFIKGTPSCVNLTFVLQPGEKYGHCIGSCGVEKVSAATLEQFPGQCSPFIQPDTEPVGSNFQVVGEYAADPPALLGCSVEKN